MKAFIIESPGNFNISDISEPIPGEGEILLRTTHCALCRTDAKMCINGHRDLKTPRIPGHEICAVNTSSGIRYAVWPGDSCGMCSMCLKGDENLCPEMRIIGFHRDGGLSEMIAVKSRNLIELPTDMPGELAALAEPLACAFNLEKQLTADSGDRIIVYGAGTMGLLVALVLSRAGNDVIVCDISPQKIRISEDFRQQAGIKAVIADDLKVEGADGAVNATSSPDAVIDAFRRLRPGGKFCFFSGLSGGQSSEMKVLNEIHYRQLKISGAYGCTRAQMQKSLHMISEEKDLFRHLIQETLGLENVPEQIRLIAEGRKLKVVVEIGG